MINFRYHVVSLTAVFLALAIGLIVGTAALNGPVADSLNERVAMLSKSNDQWREKVADLEKELSLEEDFAVEAAQIMLPNTLTGRRILVLGLPSGRDYVEGVLEMLRLTGATITGRVDILDKFVDPDNNDALLELALRAAQPTVPATGLPGNSDGAETSSALLASGLLDSAPGAPAVTEPDRRALLNAYSNAGYLTVDGKVSGPAEAVVVVSGQAYVDKNADKKDLSVVRMVAQFDKAASLVVAGSGSADGNIVATVRKQPNLAQSISTVDNSNTPQGQLTVALATVEQVATKRVGHYGIGAGRASLLPPKSTS
ncbi:copper transporter [Micromonospora sonneratiae]|uniref:Copper transporter n=1 Tax=Micromonospora sonneratiae TaxID=1184706 RepID=A0ABW3YIF3_9ACTN